MLFLVDLIFVVIIAIILAVIFGASYRDRGFTAFIMYFVILALGIWAVGGWIDPIDPTLFGAYWVSFLFIGLFLAILIAAISAPYDQRERAAKTATAKNTTSIPDQQAADEEVAVGFGIFFWVLIIGFAIAIIAGYYY